MLDRIGTTLRERYTLEALLGSGGMATVYRARHRNGHRVAIKVMHSTLSVHDDIRARFLREGYVANLVEHRGTVRVLDDDTTDDGAPFLVMELLEGETLEDRLDRNGGTLFPHETLALVRELLEILDAAHAKGIVHRDLKPENLFLTTEGELKILDFGIARCAEGSVSATRTGRIIGTPVYMAPEQARGERNKIGPPTDLWTVGAVMFRLLSGRFVYEGDTPELITIACGTRAPEKLAVVAPHLPSGLTAFVDHALEPNVLHRFQSAREMLAAARALDLDRAWELPPSLPMPARPSVPEGLSTDSRTRRPSTAHGVLVGLLAAAAILCFLFAYSLRASSTRASLAAPSSDEDVTPRPTEPPAPEPPPPFIAPTPTTIPVPRPRPTSMGALTVVCSPKCTSVVDNNTRLGAGHIFNRPTTPGRHVLELSTDNATKTIVVEVVPDQTREVKIAMSSGSYGF